jgi:hypothetical protein
MNVSREWSPAPSANRVQDVSPGPATGIARQQQGQAIDPALGSLPRPEVRRQSQASLPQRKQFAFTRLPPELKQQVIGHLDPISLAQAAASSQEVRAAATSHPDYEMTIRSGKLLKRLESLCSNPNYQPDDATVDERRHCSAFLTEAEVTKIVASALSENDHGRLKTRLIGAAISAHPQMAPAVADAVSGLETRYTRGDPQDEANRWERSDVLADVLGSIGPHAKGSVYSPFVALMQSGQYIADPHIAPKMARSLPQLPLPVADAVASFVLAQEPAGQANIPSYEHTLQLFFQLNHVSSPVQDAVFFKARETHNSIPDGDDRDFMAEEFSVEDVFSLHEGAQLPAETKDKWRALFAES